MAGEFALKITGFDDVEKALKKLGQKVASKVVKKAVRKGSRLILDRARKLVPVETGALKKSLGIKRKFYRRSSVMVEIVGPRSGHEKTDSKGRTRNPVNYAHLVEVGGILRGAGARGKGKLLGARKANSFLRKAFDENKFKALKRIETQAAAGIRQAVREVKK